MSCAGTGGVSFVWIRKMPASKSVVGFSSARNWTLAPKRYPRDVSPFNRTCSLSTSVVTSLRVIGWYVFCQFVQMKVTYCQLNMRRTQMNISLTSVVPG